MLPYDLQLLRYCVLLWQCKPPFQFDIFTMLLLCILVAVEGTVTLQKSFEADFSDSTSEAFQQEAATFCGAIDNTYKTSDLSDEYLGCYVTEFQ